MPPEWSARWKGKFDQGWDKLREETLARQIAAGVVPAGTKLAPKPEAIKDWDALSADEKQLFAHQAEVYAAYADMTDHEIGRLVGALQSIGALDDTLALAHVLLKLSEMKQTRARKSALVDLLDHLGVSHTQQTRWEGSKKTEGPQRRSEGETRRYGDTLVLSVLSVQ